VNFFGHAWVAAWFCEREPFVLGSMLPDFASVLGVAPPRSRHVELSAGIELHHQTDRIFHETAVFQGLEQRARAALAAAGVGKGARRALAHVGVEFLIDAELARRAPDWSGFAQALRYGSSAGCAPELEWRSSTPADTGQRLARLCARLAALEPPSDVVRVAARLVAALSARPRLRLHAEEVPLVQAWLEECAPEVSASLEPLLGELRSGLQSPVRQGQAASARSS
jgi:hypothetical protein